MPSLSGFGSHSRISVNFYNFTWIFRFKKNMAIFLNFLATLLLIGFTNSSPPLQLSPFTGFENEEWYHPPGVGIAFEGIRLPQNIEPLHYDLKITPIIHLPLDDSLQFTAPGEVTIRIKCLNVTDRITLHSNDIDIRHAQVTVSCL